MTSTKAQASPTDSLVAENIMAALARYKVLTVPQMLAVTGRDEKTLRMRLNGLVTGGFVGRREFRLGLTGGRLANAYWLAPKGVQWVQEALQLSARISRRDKMALSHVPHRILTVDALIAADTWARASGQSSPAFRTYMEKSTGLDLGTKAAEADAVIEVQDTQGNHRVYVLEVYCDYLQNGTNRPFEKLEPYVLAGIGNGLDDALGIEADGKAALVLVLCDHARLEERVRKGLPQRVGMPPRDKRTWQRFLFKSADELADFGNGWRRVDGSAVTLPT